MKLGTLCWAPRPNSRVCVLTSETFVSVKRIHSTAGIKGELSDSGARVFFFSDFKTLISAAYKFICFSSTMRPKYHRRSPVLFFLLYLYTHTNVAFQTFPDWGFRCRAIQEITESHSVCLWDATWNPGCPLELAASPLRSRPSIYLSLFVSPSRLPPST